MAEIDNERPTVAARVSFVTAIEGYPRSIRKGAVYAADHPVVQSNPTRFGLVNVRERPGTAASAAVRQAAERPKPVPDPVPPSAEERMADLVKAHREDLDALAKAAGVEDPESLPNKAAVAQAIVAAVARPAEEEPPIVGGLEDGAGRPADEPRDGPAQLQDATDQELAAIAHEYGVDVVEGDRDATIKAIRKSAGYRDATPPAGGLDGLVSGAPAPETPLSTDDGKSDATGAKAGTKAGSSSK